MPSSPTDSIALLIDADNAPAAKINFIVTELASHGAVNIRRALDEEEDTQAVGVNQTGPEKQLKGNTKLMNSLRSAVEATQDDDGWAALGPLGAHLNNQGPFDHRTYGFKKLSDLIGAIDLFEVEKNGSGPGTVYRVRIKNGSSKNGSSKKAPSKKESDPKGSVSASPSI